MATNDNLRVRRLLALADRKATTLPELLIQLQTLADAMRIEARSERDIERKLILSMMAGVAAMIGGHH